MPRWEHRGLRSPGSKGAIPALPTPTNLRGRSPSTCPCTSWSSPPSMTSTGSSISDSCRSWCGPSPGSIFPKSIREWGGNHVGTSTSTLFYVTTPCYLTQLHCCTQCDARTACGSLCSLFFYCTVNSFPIVNSLLPVNSIMHASS